MKMKLRQRKPSKRQWIIRLPVKPVGKQNPVPIKGRMYRAKKSDYFMSIVKVYAESVGVEMVEHCIIDVFSCYPVGLHKYKTKADVELEPKVRPDEDNVRKGIKDALHGILYTNDKCVHWGVNGNLYIDYGEMPQVIIVISECDWTDFRIASDDLNKAIKGETNDE